MTIYEQIQKSLELIERNATLSQIENARETGMSTRSFSSWFWAVTGMTYRDYSVRRHLEKARSALLGSSDSILEIALEAGYQSHEAFTRAFKHEFGLSPAYFRKSRPALEGLQKTMLIKEMYMGIIIKELPETTVACFDGYAPDSEQKAGKLLAEWKKSHPEKGKPRRVFGHNIDRHGQPANDPQNEGYRFMITLECASEADGATVAVIAPGKFLVTGIEGNFKDDPSGGWIGKGWERMQKLVQEKGYRIPEKARWFEEELEPSILGNLRLDLYLEIAQ